MRVLFVLPFLMIAAPAIAMPDDAQCAATFTMLSQSARALGLPSGAFESAAAQAGRRANAGDVAEARALTLPELEWRVVNCHARYDRGRDATRIAVAN